MHRVGVVDAVATVPGGDGLGARCEAVMGTAMERERAAFCACLRTACGQLEG